MRPERLELLEQELLVLEKATEHLHYSVERVGAVADQAAWTPEELQRFEALTSRFARLADLHIQRVMRLIDELEWVAQDSLLDRIDRAEKRGWIAADELRRIRELRNRIAHEDVDEKLHEFYFAVLQLAPVLVALTPKVAGYGRALIERYR